MSIHNFKGRREGGRIAGVILSTNSSSGADSTRVLSWNIITNLAVEIAVATMRFAGVRQALVVRVYNVVFAFISHGMDLRRNLWFVSCHLQRDWQLQFSVATVDSCDAVTCCHMWAVFQMSKPWIGGVPLIHA